MILKAVFVYIVQGDIKDISNRLYIEIFFIFLFIRFDIKLINDIISKVFYGVRFFIFPKKREIFFLKGNLILKQFFEINLQKNNSFEKCFISNEIEIYS